MAEANFKSLTNFFASFGISHLTTPPYTPQHNGSAERRHRHIVETGLILMHQASLPLSFWSHALQTPVYLINRLPTPILPNTMSPFQALFGDSPNYSKTRIFGCLCYPWLRPYAQHKLEPRSRPCIFLGYSLTQSAYKCFDPLSQRIFISRHITFDESIFPLATCSSAHPRVTSTTIQSWSPTVITTFIRFSCARLAWLVPTHAMAQ